MSRVSWQAHGLKTLKVNPSPYSYAKDEEAREDYPPVDGQSQPDGEFLCTAGPLGLFVALFAAKEGGEVESGRLVFVPNEALQPGLLETAQENGLWDQPYGVPLPVGREAAMLAASWDGQYVAVAYFPVEKGGSTSDVDVYHVGDLRVQDGRPRASATVQFPLRTLRWTQTGRHRLMLGGGQSLTFLCGDTGDGSFVVKPIRDLSGPLAAADWSPRSDEVIVVSCFGEGPVEGSVESLFDAYFHTACTLTLERALDGEVVSRLPTGIRHWKDPPGIDEEDPEFSADRNNVVHLAWLHPDVLVGLNRRGDVGLLALESAPAEGFAPSGLAPMEVPTMESRFYAVLMTDSSSSNNNFVDNDVKFLFVTHSLDRYVHTADLTKPVDSDPNIKTGQRRARRLEPAAVEEGLPLVLAEGEVSALVPPKQRVCGLGLLMSKTALGAKAHAPEECRPLLVAAGVGGYAFLFALQDGGDLQAEQRLLVDPPNESAAPPRAAAAPTPAPATDSALASAFGATTMPSAFGAGFGAPKLTPGSAAGAADTAAPAPFAFASSTGTALPPTLVKGFNFSKPPAGGTGFGATGGGQGGGGMFGVGKGEGGKGGLFNAPFPTPGEGKGGGGGGGGFFDAPPSATAPSPFRASNSSSSTMSSTGAFTFSDAIPSTSALPPSIPSSAPLKPSITSSASSFGGGGLDSQKAPTTAATAPASAPSAASKPPAFPSAAAASAQVPLPADDSDFDGEEEEEENEKEGESLGGKDEEERRERETLAADKEKDQEDAALARQRLASIPSSLSMPGGRRMSSVLPPPSSSSSNAAAGSPEQMLAELLELVEHRQHAGDGEVAGKLAAIKAPGEAMGRREAVKGLKHWALELLDRVQLFEAEVGDLENRTRTLYGKQLELARKLRLVGLLVEQEEARRREGEGEEGREEGRDLRPWEADFLDAFASVERETLVEDVEELARAIARMLARGPHSGSSNCSSLVSPQGGKGKYRQALRERHGQLQRRRSAEGGAVGGSEIKEWVGSQAEAQLRDDVMRELQAVWAEKDALWQLLGSDPEKGLYLEKARAQRRQQDRWRETPKKVLGGGGRYGVDDGEEEGEEREEDGYGGSALALRGRDGGGLRGRDGGGGKGGKAGRNASCQPPLTTHGRRRGVLREARRVAMLLGRVREELVGEEEVDVKISDLGMGGAAALGALRKKREERIKENKRKTALQVRTAVASTANPPPSTSSRSPVASQSTGGASTSVFSAAPPSALSGGGDKPTDRMGGSSSWNNMSGSTSSSGPPSRGPSPQPPPTLGAVVSGGFGGAGGIGGGAFGGRGERYV